MLRRSSENTAKSGWLAKTAAITAARSTAAAAQLTMSTTAKTPLIETASTAVGMVSIVIASIGIARDDRLPMIVATSTIASRSITTPVPTYEPIATVIARTVIVRAIVRTLPLMATAISGAADYNRGDRRTGDDPFSPADNDPAPRRRERRRSDDRSGLQPASDSTDDLAQSTIEENQWLSSLPSLTDELRQLALRAWRKTRPERRRELTRRISTGSVPDLIRKTLQEWIDGPPPATSAGGSDDERAELEKAIARSLVATRADRPAAIDDIEAQLKGIPDDVALNVLRDWKADLSDTSSNADPRTTDRSSLNDRILKQLDKSGISLRTLDAATRDRLRGTDAR